MRRALTSRTKLHQRPEYVLYAAFAKAMGIRKVDQYTKASIEQFVEAWGALGVRVPKRLALGIFNRYGQDVKGFLPIFVFSSALLSGAARRLVSGSPCTPQR